MLSEAKLLVDFLRYALPLVPGLREVACAFWQCRVDLGPMPPDLSGFDAVDRRHDAAMAAKRAKP
jgi:hypothetical protein